jgi:hypothetical protein
MKILMNRHEIEFNENAIAEPIHNQSNQPPLASPISSKKKEASFSSCVNGYRFSC